MQDRLLVAMNSRLSRYLVRIGLILMLCCWTRDAYVSAQRPLAVETLRDRQVVAQLDKQADDIAKIKEEMAALRIDQAVLKAKSEDNTWWFRLIAGAVTLQLLALLWARKVKRHGDKDEE